MRTRGVQIHGFAQGVNRSKNRALSPERLISLFSRAIAFNFRTTTPVRWPIKRYSIATRPRGVYGMRASLLILLTRWPAGNGVVRCQNERY